MADNRGANTGKGVGVGTGLGIMAGTLALLFFALWVMFHDQTVRFLLKYAYYLNLPLAWITPRIGIVFFAKATQEIVVLAAHPASVSVSYTHLRLRRCDRKYRSLTIGTARRIPSRKTQQHDHITQQHNQIEA